MGLAAGLFLFTSANYKSLEEQTAAIDKMVQEKVDNLVATKAAECEETAKRKAAKDAGNIIATLPKKTIAPPPPAAKTTPKKPVKPTQKPVPAKPAPPVVKEAPKPAPKDPKLEDAVLNKRADPSKSAPKEEDPAKSIPSNTNLRKRGGGGQ